jgi:hypothetical protein
MLCRICENAEVEKGGKCPNCGNSYDRPVAKTPEVKKEEKKTDGKFKQNWNK